MPNKSGTWEMAQSMCLDIGYHLVQINNEEEWLMIYRFTSKELTNQPAIFFDAVCQRHQVIISGIHKFLLSFKIKIMSTSNIEFSFV